MREPASQALSVLSLRPNPWPSAILDDLVSEPLELFEGQGRFVVQRYDPTADALRSLMSQHRKSSQGCQVGCAGNPEQNRALEFCGRLNQITVVRSQIE